VTVGRERTDLADHLEPNRVIAEVDGLSGPHGSTTIDFSPDTWLLTCVDDGLAVSVTSADLRSCMTN
jgi:hypothetical protein